MALLKFSEHFDTALKVHFDAGDASSLVVESGEIRQFLGQDGTVDSSDMIFSGVRPAYVTNVIGGRSVARMSGDDDSWFTGSSVTIGNSWMIGGVFRMGTGNDSNRRILTITDGTNADWNSANTMSLWLYNGSNTAWRTFANSSERMTWTTPAVDTAFPWVMVSTGSALALYIDGASTPVATATYSFTGGARWLASGTHNAPTGTSNSQGRFDMGEVFAVDGTTDTDDLDIAFGIMAHKWSLTDRLPGGHPYKTTMPEGAPTGPTFLAGGWW